MFYILDISIHTPTKGATSWSLSSGSLFRYFNPHSHEGSDFSRANNTNKMYISIHTPTKGATKLVGDSEEVVIFQSTLPRRERLLQKEGQGDIWVISIHTPTKGATSYTLDWRCWNFNFNPHSHEGSDWISSSFSLQKLNFNPHSHEGSDDKADSKRSNTNISIHTPTKGATKG